MKRNCQSNENDCFYPFFLIDKVKARQAKRHRDTLSYTVKQEKIKHKAIIYIYRQKHVFRIFVNKPRSKTYHRKYKSKQYIWYAFITNKGAQIHIPPKARL